ncbi:MAG: hypothetical protein ACI9F9_002602, partial [Candidatus Paceibacteria bacterium]
MPYEGQHQRSDDPGRDLTVVALFPMRKPTLFLLCSALVLWSCGNDSFDPSGSAGSGTAAEPAGEPWFENQAAASGLSFMHNNGATGEYYFPEKIGTGSALLDFDGDGYLDIFCVQSGKVGAAPGEVYPHGLFRNLGNGRFEDVTEGSGVGVQAYGIAVTAGDFDGDGRTDLYLLNVGANVLLR